MGLDFHYTLYLSNSVRFLVLPFYFSTNYLLFIPAPGVAEVDYYFG